MSERRHAAISARLVAVGVRRRPGRGDRGRGDGDPRRRNRLPRRGRLGAAAPATAAAVREIPPARLRIYQAAGRRFDIEWAFLASIGTQECGHGACADVNPSGCGGPMQIAIVRESACSPGSGPTIWERYRRRRRRRRAPTPSTPPTRSSPRPGSCARSSALRRRRLLRRLPPGRLQLLRRLRGRGRRLRRRGDGAGGRLRLPRQAARRRRPGQRGRGRGRLGLRGGGPRPGPRATQIVRIAQSQLGTLENPPGSNCNPYGPCVEWCSLFVAWVWKRAGVPLAGGTAPYAYSGSIYEWAKAREGGPFAASAPGDPPFSTAGPAAPASCRRPRRRHPATPSSTASGPSASDHVGIVERVFPGGQITTIDGNFGDRVARSGPFLPARAAAYGSRRRSTATPIRPSGERRAPVVERLRALLERPLDPSAARAVIVLASAILLGFAAALRPQG